MTQLKVYTKEDAEGGYNGTILNELRPRRYMTAYTFAQLLNYAAEALNNNLINAEDVITFEIFNRAEHWTDYIEKGE